MSISAGSVVPDGKVLYRVTEAHDHDCLKVGDEVRLLVFKSANFLLLRMADWTLHPIEDRHEQYVHLEEVKP